MAEENVANAPNEEIPVEEPAGLYDADEIADAFLAAGSEAEPEPEAKQEDAPAVEGQEQPAGEEQEAAAPDPVMPEGWEEAMWQAATPEMRAKVAEQATAHAAELAAERKAMADLKARQEAFAVQANAQLQQALTTMQQVIEGEFRQVDWNGLAASDPASYVQLQRMYNDRMAAVQGIQQGIARQVQAMQQQRAQEEAQRLHTEFDAVLPEIKALVGAGFAGKKFAAEVADYLAKQGFPAEAINGISRGHELKTAVKAMLYDKLASQRAKAAAKVAEAPKVSQPRGSAKDSGGNDRLKKAMSYLAKNPNSTDAAAAVFENL
jgi:hypothetical protein